MKKVMLNNGLRVIVQNIPSQFASLHLDVGFGTYHEAQGIVGYDNGSLIGANHFIEHLVFGDTRRYSSEEIAELDSLCREANAEEGTINTDYWVKLFSPQNLDHVLSVLTSILFGAMFKLEDVDTERGTIFSEIRIAHDNVTDMSETNNFLTDLFSRTMYDVHPFRLPLLGTKGTVENLERKVLFDLYQKYYVPNNMVLCIVGGVDEVKGIILDNLTRLSTEEVTEDELRLSQRSLIGAHQRMMVDVEGLAEKLCWWERLGMGAESYGTYPDKISAVTPNDIQRIAQRHLNPGGYVLVGVKPIG